MSRQTIASVVLLCIALASVVAGALDLIRKDRAALLDRFAAERQAQLEEASRGVREALEGVGADLRFTSELLSQPGTERDHERELRALLEVVVQYKAIATYDGEGQRRLSLIDRRAETAVRRGASLPAMTRAARQALSGPSGGIVTSMPVEELPGGWYRVFATSLSGEGQPRGAVAVLIDTEPLFAPLRLIAAQPEVRLLLLGAHGLPTPASDEVLAGWVRGLTERAPHGPGFPALIQRMRAGEQGTLRLVEDEAAQLGLGAAEAVAAFTPIRVKGGAHWSVATIVSTRTLRSLEHGVIVRMSLAAALVAMFLVAFGTYVVLASRRAVALQESRRHADRLAHLHDTTQKILDNIPTGVLALTAAGRIQAVNQALRRRLPPTPLGATLADTFPEAPAPVVIRLQQLVDESCATQRVLSIHGEPLALFGQEGQFRIHAVPLEPRDPDVRVLLVIEDLSDVRALESQLLRAEKLATVGILAAGIAHEIGTPLGVVRGRAEYTLGKLGPGHPQASSVQVIIDQIDRVSRTIRQLLDFARVQPAAVQPVGLAPLARSVRELLQVEVDRRGLRLELDIPEALPPVAADPDQLQQVLVNLALNACDACGPGGGVRLSASAEAAAGPGRWGWIRVTIQDDGCGIPGENLNQVFDPFFTTKKRGQGSGLGLTIVAQIVRNHGGQVDLESEPGRGTCVTLLWPVAPWPAEERHAG